MNVEKSMQLRRKRLHFVLSDNQIAPSISTFPLLGVRNNSKYFANNLNGPIADSQYITDDLINPHPRFGALTQNIRLRRGANVNIIVPADNEETIHMDAMAFGMGCCCLQVTMQCRSDEESRFLHDQLAVLSPLMQALSASTPVLKGKLAATDTRW
jgi:glutamate--cysteine ligase catalytic subunit